MLPNVMFVVALRHTSKTCWYSSTTAYSRVEMGQSQYGLHHWLSKNPERKRCYLRCYRSTLKSCSLPSHPRVYYCQSVSRLVCLESCITSWCSFGNQF